MILFSDRGTPDGYHNMHGYSGHTFKFVNKDGKYHYVQVHLRKDGGAKSLTNDEAVKLAGENPEYGIQTLFEDIENGKFPSWTVYVVCLGLLLPDEQSSNNVTGAIIANHDTRAS